ncbi:MAG: hypothetical protein NTW65_11295 [Deltaproteobacteria bacterium]|nr:hypothetical protein [Deltaproteobacteria bacterium]
MKEESMEISQRRIPLLIGFIDGLVFFIIVILLYIFGGGDKPSNCLVKVFTLFLWETIFILFPFSCFVGWMGKKDAERILSGKVSFLRPIVEGFSIAFLIIAFWLFLGALQTAFAAGTIYDDASSWGFHEWLNYSWHVTTIPFIAGCIGAAFGFVLHGINCLVIRNMKFQN